MTWIKTAVAALLTVATTGAAHAQVATKKELTIERARHVIAAAAAEAKKNSAGGVIAVVDDGGNLIALDGLEVDQRDNLYVAGPGGLWIISPEARHLGTIQMPELPANFAWATRTAAPST